ncbi:MAG: TIGR04282 family arsenosugar biosynthesis glycosyltransferase, partial [Solimonas sp.]
RRLARQIGQTAALRFYRTILGQQIRRLADDRRWSVWLFITPDDSLDHPAWRGVPLRRVIGQGSGDLGQRMKRPFEALPPGPVVLVGSDIPAMRPDHVAHAFHLLGRHDLVFGPASDGGFWLVGARRVKPMPRSLFADVRWSTMHTLADTLAGLPQQLSIALADMLDDVDDADDLRRLQLCAQAR